MKKDKMILKECFWKGKRNVVERQKSERKEKEKEVEWMTYPMLTRSENFF